MKMTKAGCCGVTGGGWVGWGEVLVVGREEAQSKGRERPSALDTYPLSHNPSSISHSHGILGTKFLPTDICFLCQISIPNYQLHPMLPNKIFHTLEAFTA